MNDTKNILLAWASAGTTLLSTFSDGLMALVSAVVLPIVFFAVGKTVDVCVQLYINRKKRETETRPSGAPAAASASGAEACRERAPR